MNGIGGAGAEPPFRCPWCRPFVRTAPRVSVLHPSLHPALVSRLLVPTLLLLFYCSCCACSCALVLLSFSLRHFLVLLLRRPLRTALVRSPLASYSVFGIYSVFPSATRAL